MQKSFIVHYKNKYPNARVEYSDNHLQVLSKDGEVLVSLRRGGGGSLIDFQKQDGAKYAHDLSPIPKNTRVYKLTHEHEIEKDEESQDRSVIAKHFCDTLGYVPSIEECRKHFGLSIDQVGNVELK